MSIVRAEFVPGDAVLQACWQLQISSNWQDELIQNLTTIQLVQRTKQLWFVGEWELYQHHFCE